MRNPNATDESYKSGLERHKEKVLGELAKYLHNYANADYLVSEENYPQGELDKATQELKDFISQAIDSTALKTKEAIMPEGSYQDGEWGMGENYVIGEVEDNWKAFKGNETAGKFDQIIDKWNQEAEKLTEAYSICRHCGNRINSEEVKMIEKLEYYKYKTDLTGAGVSPITDIELMDKINELIEAVNKLQAQTPAGTKEVK